MNKFNAVIPLDEWNDLVSQIRAIIDHVQTVSDSGPITQRAKVVTDYIDTKVISLQLIPFEDRSNEPTIN